MRTDEELMAAYAGGDARAFDELFARYAPALLRLMSKDLFRPADAKDLVQHTFLQVHRHRLNYEVGRPLRPWIFTIAMNLKREYFRRHKARPESVLTEQMLRDEPVAFQAHAQVEHRQRLTVALQELPKDQAEVITLHWLGGVPLPEVASIVGASLSAVKVRAHRGYAHMRERLSRLEDSSPNLCQSGQLPSRGKERGSQ